MILQQIQAMSDYETSSDSSDDVESTACVASPAKCISSSTSESEEVEILERSKHKKDNRKVRRQLSAAKSKFRALAEDEAREKKIR